MHVQLYRHKIMIKYRRLLVCYYRLQIYAIIEMKTPAETFPRFPSIKVWNDVSHEQKKNKGTQCVQELIFWETFSDCWISDFGVGEIYYRMFKSVHQNSFKRYSFCWKRKLSFNCKQKLIQLLNCRGMMRSYILLPLSIVVDLTLTGKPFEINTNTHHFHHFR